MVRDGAAGAASKMNRTAPEQSRGGPINYSDADAGELVPQLSQFAAFIQQRIRHVDRRQRTAPLLSRKTKSRHQSQLGVDRLDARMRGT
jgi:hypothetical protein